MSVLKTAKVYRTPAGRWPSAIVLGLLALALACGDNPVSGGTSPAEVRVESGSGQQAQVAEALPRLLSARVVDADGVGVPDVTVAWSVATGGGTVTAVSGRTDNSGVASASWRLGHGAGAQSVTATVAGLPPATFTATALPGPATTIVLVDGQLQSAGAGTRLDRPLVVEARDAFGNPVPGVAIQWSIQAGGGNVSPSSPVTGPDGRASAEWTLGPIPGAEHRAVANLPQGPAAVFIANAVAGQPAVIEVVGGEGQMGEAGSELPEPLRIRVLDAGGHPVPDVAVTWNSEPGDSFRSPSTVTDGLGEATAFWRLGSSPTRRTVTVGVEGLDPVTFTAHAFSSLPVNASVSGLSGDGGTRTFFRVSLGGTSSTLTVTAPGAGGKVELYARHGDLPSPAAHDCAPSPAGDPTCVVPNAQPGDYYVLVDALADYDGLELRASIPLNVSLENAFITQAAQNWGGAVPLVAGRPGLLRVFAEASAPGVPAPPVRVTFYHGTAQVGEFDVSRPGTIPTGITPETQTQLAGSWNLIVPADLVQPGLAFRVELDPDGEFVDDDGDDDVLPRGDDVRVVEVVETPAFRVTFVPVHSSATGRTGQVDESNVEEFLASARKVLPLGEIDWQIRAPITVDFPIVDDNWLTLIKRLGEVHRDDGRPDRHYYGVVNLPPGQRGTLGIGQVRGPVAAGSDEPINGERSWIAAHEWGHNFGRLHSPCGVTGDVDPQYPYDGGRIGIYGVDVNPTVESSSVLSPAHGDLMGYCPDRWVSDYTFERILNFRAQQAGQAVHAGFAGEDADQASAREPVLLVSGHVAGAEYELDPAIRLETLPALPEGTGPYTLDGFDQDGNRLFTFSFSGTLLADTELDEVRQFGFAIPEEIAPADRLHRIRLSGPDGEAVLVASGPAGAPPPAVLRPAARPGTGRAAAVTWDAAAFPMVVVRDAESGQIVGIGRTGTLTLADAPDELEILYSDGVRSWISRERLQR